MISRHTLGNARPLVLRAEATLLSNQQLSPNTISLQNPTGQPFEVTEFKFYIRPEDPLIGSVSGAFIWAEIKMGKHPMTDGFMPIWLMGPSRFLDLEQFGPIGWGYLYNSSFAGRNGLAFKRRADACYTWRLPRPMYVPPGETVNVRFQHAGMLDVTTIVGLSAKGRTTDRAQSSSKIPFASWWQSKFFEWDGAAEEVESPENVLNNKTAQTLHVEHICGRIPQSIQFVSEASPDNVPVNSQLVQDGQNGFLERWLEVRMWDSIGNQLVRSPTLFRNVFSWERGWQISFDLPSSQYLKVRLQKTTTPAAYELNALNEEENDFTVAFRGAAQISIVGWREEKL